MTCPMCQRPAAPRVAEDGATNRFFPFCSEHCKLVDLAKWMGEEYRIPGPPAPEALAEVAGRSPDDDTTVH